MAKAVKGAVNSYDEELAKFAKQYASAESKASGGAAISFKGGHITIDGKALPGDKMQVVIVDAAFCNTYYEGAYNPEKTASPDCFALSYDEESLAPHEEATAPQHEACSGCPMNAFGTANVGKGKACKNCRRIVVLSEGDIEEPASIMRVASIPPTSTKFWAGYVQQVATALGKPLPFFAVVTEIQAKQHDKNQIEISFAYKRSLTTAEIKCILDRRKQASEIVMMPYPKKEEVEEAPKRGRSAVSSSAAKPKVNKFAAKKGRK